MSDDQPRGAAQTPSDEVARRPAPMPRPSRPATAAGRSSAAHDGPDASRPTPPRPGRPDVAVTPMREPVPDERPRIIGAGLAVWAVTLLALAATAALVAVRQRPVRAELKRSLASDNASASAREIANTVDISMVAAAGVAVVVALLVVYGAVRIRERVIGGRTVLTAVGGVTVIGSIAFWTVLSPARDLLNPAATVLPFVVAVLAALATGLLFAPTVTRWLKAAPLR